FVGWVESSSTRRSVPKVGRASTTHPYEWLKGHSPRSASAWAARAELVADAGGALVILAGDGLVELLAERLGDREVLADLGLEQPELLHQREVGDLILVLVPPGVGVRLQAGGALADRVDGLVGPAPLQRQRGRRLGAVEQDQAAEAVVAGGVLVVVRV